MAWWQYNSLNTDSCTMEVRDMIADNVWDANAAAGFYSLIVAPVSITGQNTGFNPADNIDVTFYPINNIYFDGQPDTYLPYANQSGAFGIYSFSSQRDSNIIAGMPLYIGVTDGGQYGFVMGANVRPVMTPPAPDTGGITPLEGIAFVGLAAFGMNWAFGAIDSAVAAAGQGADAAAMSVSDATAYQSVAEAAMQDAAANYAATAAGIAESAAAANASDLLAAASVDAGSTVPELANAAQGVIQASSEFDAAQAAAAQAIDDQGAAEAWSQSVNEAADSLNQSLTLQQKAIDQSLKQVAQDVINENNVTAAQQEIYTAAQGDTATFDVAVTPVTDAPVIAPSVPPGSQSWLESAAAWAAKQGLSTLTSTAIAAGLRAILGTNAAPPAFVGQGALAARAVAAAPVQYVAPPVTRYIGQPYQPPASNVFVITPTQTAPAPSIDGSMQSVQTIANGATLARVALLVGAVIFGSKS